MMKVKDLTKNLYHTI